MEKFLKKVRTTSSGLAVIIVAVLAVNVIANKLNMRLDVTQDKLFTLSDSTTKLLENLDTNIQAQFFFTRSLKEVPPIVKTYADRVEELLKEYAELSGNKISVEIIDPKPDTDEEEWARKYGISNVRLAKGEELFFGLALLKGANEHVIPYFDPRREEFLEYDLTEALVRVLDQEKTKVGIYSSLPIFGNPMGGIQAWAFVDELRRSFEVFDLSQDIEKVSESNVIVLFHPKQISDAHLYKIDQFLMKGGRLVVAVEPFSRADLANAAQSGDSQQMFRYEPNSNLFAFFNAWDIEYNYKNIIGDKKLATQITTSDNRFPYPYFISMGPESFSKEHILTNNLPSFLYAEGGAFSLKKDSAFKLEPLIETSDETGEQEPKMLQFTGPYSFAQSFEPKGGKRTIAGLVSGQFRSAFPNGVDEKKADGHLSEAEKETSVLIVADTDFIHDSNAADRFRFGNQVVVRPRNGNLSFFVNAVEFLGGRDELIAIRSRGKIARPFTKLMEIQSEAQDKWKNVEEELSQNIQKLQEKINEMQKERTDGNKFVALSSEQQAEIAKFREQEVEFRKKRREVRKNLREDIEKLQRKLMLANLLIIPFGVFGFSIAVFARRNNRQGKGDS